MKSYRTRNLAPYRTTVPSALLPTVLPYSLRYSSDRAPYRTRYHTHPLLAVLAHSPVKNRARRLLLNVEPAISTIHM